MIRFSTLDVDLPLVEPQRDKEWIEAVVSGYGKSIGELYYYFCSDEKLLEINRERLGHDFYTDIVTFPLTDCEKTPPRTSGRSGRLRYILKKKRFVTVIFALENEFLRIIRPKKRFVTVIRGSEVLKTGKNYGTNRQNHRSVP